MIALSLGFPGAKSDQQKFNRLYMLHRQAMYSAAYQILKDAYSAEDAVHNAFLKIISCLDRLDEPDSKASRNYLLIVARNEAIRIYHRNKPQIPVESVEEEAVDIQDVQLEAESREVQKKIYDLISNMDMNYRDILMLKFYYDLDDREIADTLDISLSNARVRLHRARLKLKAMLREVYDHE